MKIIALVANALLLGFIIYLLFAKGMPNGNEIWIVILLALVPILNIYAIRSSTGDDWISLWFRRKALEEKKKIERLTNVS